MQFCIQHFSQYVKVLNIRLMLFFFFFKCFSGWSCDWLRDRRLTEQDHQCQQSWRLKHRGARCGCCQSKWEKFWLACLHVCRIKHPESVIIILTCSLILASHELALELPIGQAPPVLKGCFRHFCNIFTENTDCFTWFHGSSEAWKTKTKKSSSRN